MNKFTRTVTTVTEVVDWNLVPDGTPFTAKYNGNAIAGIVRVEEEKRGRPRKDGAAKEASKRFYLLNNFELTNYDEPASGLAGYTHSLHMDEDDRTPPFMENNEGYSLSEVVLHETITPDIQKILDGAPVQVGEYSVLFGKGYIRYGCTRIENDLVKKIASKLID